VRAIDSSVEFDADDIVASQAAFVDPSRRNPDIAILIANGKVPAGSRCHAIAINAIHRLHHGITCMNNVSLRHCDLPIEDDKNQRHQIRWSTEPMIGVYLIGQRQFLQLAGFIQTRSAGFEVALFEILSDELLEKNGNYPNPDASARDSSTPSRTA